MKIHIAIMALALLVSCRMDKNDARQKNNSYPFYVGSYTNKESRGVYKYLLHKDGSLKQIGLAAISDNPAFLAITADKKFLLAVNEIDQNGVGFVESFSIRGDSLKLISRRSSGGAHPCFITVNEMGFVLVANYTGGNVGLLRLDEEGKWLGQALIRKSNTQPMIICRVEGRDDGAKQAIEDEFFGVLSGISTKAVPKLDLASDDYIREILPRFLRQA